MQNNGNCLSEQKPATNKLQHKVSWTLRYTTERFFISSPACSRFGCGSDIRSIRFSHLQFWRRALERHRGHSRLTDQHLTQCLILLGSQSFCVKLLNKSLLHWCLGADIVNDHTQQQMPWLLTTMNCFTELWTTICFTYCGLFPARRDSRPHSWAEMMEKCVNVTVTPIKEKNTNHNWIWIATTQFGLISKNVFMKLLGSGRNLSHLFRFESLASNLRRALHAHVQINLPELTVHWHTWRAEAVTAKACLPFNLHPKELELV